MGTSLGQHDVENAQARKRGMAGQGTLDGLELVVDAVI
jgi:hypothetical protein